MRQDILNLKTSWTSWTYRTMPPPPNPTPSSGNPYQDPMSKHGDNLCRNRDELIYLG